MFSARIIVAGSLTAFTAMLGIPFLMAEAPADGISRLHSFAKTDIHASLLETVKIKKDGSSAREKNLHNEINLPDTKNAEIPPVSLNNEEYETVGFKEIPFYSQFADISNPARKKIGCGVASLAMIIKHYNPDLNVSVDRLFQEGIDAGAYLSGIGWIHQGLINLSHKYGLKGSAFDFSGKNMEEAFNHLIKSLEKGPVIASVFYTFDPQSPIPHLAVINGVSEGYVFYNDPAEEAGGKRISIADFKKGWKKRYIAIAP